MSGTKLKLASSHPPRSPERAALAEVISRRDAMAHEIEAARAAETKARERKLIAKLQ